MSTYLEKMVQAYIEGYLMSPIVKDGPLGIDAIPNSDEMEIAQSHCEVWLRGKSSKEIEGLGADDAGHQAWLTVGRPKYL